MGEKALTLKDYDRNVIEKKGGIVDEEAETMQVVGNIKSFAQEQNDLKNEFKKIGEDLEDSSDEELFTKKAVKLDSTPASTDVSEKVANMDDEEKFIFDYLLNKKWNDQEGSDVDYSSGEELADRKYHKDETDVAKMFKRKLIEQVNADNGELKITPQTFADIPREEQRDSKSYPREGLISVRQNEKAERRAEKRAKKKAEKELKIKQRKEEISRQKNEKIEDLKSKMEQLKEAIGMDIDLDPEMFEGDFEIDDVMPQIMAKIEQGDYDDDMKPEFNDDIEGFDFSDEEPVEKKPKKSKRGKRSKKGEIDESDLKTAEKIFPESVKQIEELDQEVDIVGDEELRFKYKWSQPLTFGLTTEEILNATDAELNTWKSLKQVTKQMTPDELENEHNYWSRLNPQKLEERKKRVFRSIYGTEEEKERIAESTENKKGKKMNSKRRRQLRAREALLKLEDEEVKEETETQEVKTEKLVDDGEDEPEVEETSVTNDDSIKKNKKRRRKKKDGKVQKMTDERLAAYNLDPKEFRKSHKYNDLSLKYKAE